MSSEYKNTDLDDLIKQENRGRLAGNVGGFRGRGNNANAKGGA